MTLESFLHELGQPWRRAGPDAWGITLPDVGGWPLDIGLAVRDRAPSLLALQAPVCAPGAVDAAALLYRNRGLTLVRFSSTLAGEVWLQGELPWPLDGTALLERALSALVEAAQDVRYVASASRTDRSRYSR
jgi:hypothetical protein